MNIKILDSWLRVYLSTKATPEQIAKHLSLCSVSVESLEKTKITDSKSTDYIYDIEITTNRPDLMSLTGLAREASAALNQNNINAKYTFTTPPKPSTQSNSKTKITIHNDSSLVNRVCAVAMEVQVKPSPPMIQKRLESTDIRSLNNLIDITNYVMRTIGHPTHIFDLDRLDTSTLTIRESKTGEKIKTLDKKTYTLPGGDIVAVNDKNEIIDLLGIMGLENSVITDQTKKILFFIDSNDPTKIRKTSMSLALRSEAAVLNEKGPDPETAIDALFYGIELFKKFANAKIISPIVDIYPNKTKTKTISVSEEKINSVIGIPIPLKKSETILKNLGFTASIHKNTITAGPPSFRSKDIEIPEDLIEEIARIYGYHNIPNSLPPTPQTAITDYDHDPFIWEKKTKDALKYWGFTETYTYSLVSRDIINQSPKFVIDSSLQNSKLSPPRLQNPLSSDYTYMRTSLTPSLLKVIKENPDRDEFKLFEIAFVYHDNPNKLPSQNLHLALAIQQKKFTLFHLKGILEQLCQDLGISDLNLIKENESINIYLEKNMLGFIQTHDTNIFTLELNFENLIKHATNKKTYKSLPKYPPIIEDLCLIVPHDIATGDIISTIQKQNPLVVSVSLLDKYKNTRTFHINYQSYHKNLTDSEVGDIRAKILQTLSKKFNTRLK